MLLPALIAYEQRKVREDESFEVQLGVVPSGYQRQPVKGFVELDAQGEFVRFRPTAGSDPKKDRGRVYIVPHIMRSSAIRPKLLADNAEYVFGIGRKTDEHDPKVAQRHAAFIEAVQECFEATGNASVGAVLRYLKDARSAPAFGDSFDPTLNYSFMVGERRPFEDEDVQAYWASKTIGSGEVTDDGDMAESMISGDVGQLMSAEPVKIKGIPGGQVSGMNLVSANAPAFLSYGLGSSAQAPILAVEAETYANGLNRLLSDDSTRYSIGPVVYVFWTGHGDVPPVADALAGGPAVDLFGLDDDTSPRSGRPEQIRTRLKSIWTGEGHSLVLDSEFFAVALSASGSRVVIRSFVPSTVQELMGRLAYFFAAQMLVQWDGSAPKPQGIYSLAASLVRNFKKEASPQGIESLVAFALSGARLPYDFLARLAGRNRAERRVTYPRAVLTKMTLTSLGVIPMGELEQVDASNPDVGYQLGRLLAVLDGIQRSALGKGVNATLSDRFYGSMSTAPLSVFGRIMQGAQPHLARLRKERPGAYNRVTATLEEVMGRIDAGSVPRLLTLEQQALFALGYYHQRAEVGRNIAAHKLAKLGEGTENALEEEDDG
ncbi:MAG: type I-C CRISPR-associated protein Cas8c/Csd1 [Trueperaceae bacterium]|nr:type I-C CRISPR-associated protein Cas8c/Csd1 [Trueperaceae bacterium]